MASRRVDRRVLAVLEFLSASGLRPTVSARSCTQAPGAAHAASSAGSAQETVAISAANGLPVATRDGPSSIATVVVHKLANLQGAMKPLEIASSTRFAGAPDSVALPGYAGVIQIAFIPLGAGDAHAAGVLSSGGLTPSQWLELVARLGEVPDPTVSAKPSPAAIPDHSGALSSSATEGK